MRLSPSWAVALLCLVYLLAGLLGHDPWKTDDAVNLGIAYEFFRDGDWLRPRLVNEAWFAQPPLFHWLAAGLGRALAPLLAFHNSGRLATALLAAVMLLALLRAARPQGQSGQPWGAPLLAIGCLGLLVPIHEAQPMVGLMAGQALVLHGLLNTADKQVRAVIALVSGLAIGLLSVGLTGLLPLVGPVLAGLCLPDRWPRRAAAVVPGLLLGIGIAALWPGLIAVQAPDAYPSLVAAELAKLRPLTFEFDDLRDHLELLGWSAWPVLPIALWALWAQRKQLAEYAHAIRLLALLFALAQITVFQEPSPLAHLALLPPLTLIAATGVDRLKRGATNAFDWFGMMTFTLMGGVIWLGGIALMTGEPARVAKNFTKAEPGFIGTISWPALLAAVLISLIWLYSVFRLQRSPWRSVIHWALGITTIWGLLTSLWMPWMDYGKTYRPVAISLADTLRTHPGCITARNVGDGQRASLRYFADITTQRLGSARGRKCSLLLVQGEARNENAPAGWKKIWEGNRPGDRAEKLRLYQRRSDAGNGDGAEQSS